MNVLQRWAEKWGISPAAIHDLRNQLGANAHEFVHDQANTEAGVQNQVRLKAGQLGWHLWRNNVGACEDSNGNFLRYGLCNDSKRVNLVLKSSDLIGIRAVRITSAMIGSTIGQFCAFEVKRPGWRNTGTEREQAQENFINLIEANGGHAKFITSAAGVEND